MTTNERAAGASAAAPASPTRFSELAARLLAADPSVTAARMLHAPGLRTAGGFFAFSNGRDVVVKLPAARVAALVAAGEGRPCVIRKGSPLREWVCLDPGHDRLDALVTEARDFVATIERKR